MENDNSEKNQKADRSYGLLFQRRLVQVSKLRPYRADEGAGGSRHLLTVRWQNGSYLMYDPHDSRTTQPAG